MLSGEVEGRDCERECQDNVSKSLIHACLPGFLFLSLRLPLNECKRAPSGARPRGGGCALSRVLVKRILSK